jgi:NhaP-type Na+/H+ or K+/H+ antiporter
MHIEAYTLLLFGLGAIILLVAWLPLALKQLPLSLPIICVLIGFGLQRMGYLSLDLEQLYANPRVERLTEAVVLIALMGAGLRLDRRFSLRRWASTWRLLFLAMPLTIVLLTLAAHYGLGWSWPVSLLLGAALAPTDPVLASDVQTGPPGEGEQGEVRFALTSEAGLNDGLAFPFVMLAILGLKPEAVPWLHWFSVDLVLELVVGAVIGWGGGRLMGFAMFHLPKLRLSDTGDGLVAVAVTLMAYATAQALHANGFVTVFVAAAAIRRSAPVGDFHHAMSAFSEQIERVLVMLVLLLFGWGLGAGLLAPLTWEGALVALALIFVFRPLSAWLSFLRTPVRWQAKALMAFFGIRGIGTLYYLQYAFNRSDFAETRALAAVAAFAILVSILVHGITSTPLMQMADAFLARRRARRRHETPHAAN